MLIIRRRVGERIVIGSNIEVTVAAASKRVVRLAIAAPKGIPVLRGEVHDAVVAANRAATAAIIEVELPIGAEDEEATPEGAQNNEESTDTHEGPTKGHVRHGSQAPQEMRS